ncbi:hypothetical protein ACEQ8H_007080 [Pleosporales sp. CAS-2024a]
MAYEQFRIYGYNHGNEPEHYRLHVQDHRTIHPASQHGRKYDTLGSYPAPDYTDRTQQSRPDHGHGSYKKTRSKPSRSRSRDYYSTEDYISPPTEGREDYIVPNYDTAWQQPHHEPWRQSRMPGGFQEDQPDRPSRPRISRKEKETIHQLMQETKFGNHHEIMRAYWVPQEYDAMAIEEDRSRSRTEMRREGYGSHVQTYADDSVDEAQDWDMDEPRAQEARGRWRPSRRASADASHGPSSRMPGGYASSSPGIRYESDEEDDASSPYHPRRRSVSRGRAFPSRKYSQLRHSSSSSPPRPQRYLSSSPEPLQQRLHYHHHHHQNNNSRHHSCSRRYTSASPSPSSMVSTNRTRIQHAPSPPPAITHSYSQSRRDSFSSSSLSPSRSSSGHHVPVPAVRYASDHPDTDSDGNEDCDMYESDSDAGHVMGRARYAVSDAGSDFVINGGSDWGEEDGDIWDSEE